MLHFPEALTKAGTREDPDLVSDKATCHPQAWPRCWSPTHDPALPPDCGSDGHRAPQLTDRLPGKQDKDHSQNYSYSFQFRSPPSAPVPATWVGLSAGRRALLAAVTSAISHVSAAPQPPSKLQRLQGQNPVFRG